MNKIAFVVFFFLLSTPVMADTNDKALKDEINAKVTQLSYLLKDSYAEEYLAARGIQLLKNGIGSATVAAAVFTIESFGKGNNYYQYLAVFLSIDEESEGYPPRFSLLDFMMVGGKGIRGIEFDQIKIKKTKNGILITIPAMEYGPNDPMCCPSIESIAQFKLNANQLVGSRLEEIKKQAKKDTTHKR